MSAINVTIAPAPHKLRTTSVTLRIVVYGPAAAGKTTTARALGESLGSRVETPEEEADGTTVFFDWMEFEGGSFEGQPIRTQMITVPGHDKARRVPMLKIADVILFVADTTEAGIDDTVELFAEMIEELHEISATPSVIVQANKRDDATALPMERVRQRLDLSEDDALVETVASESEGVRVALVLAMRHGMEQVRLRADEPDTAPVDKDELLAHLRAVESTAVATEPRRRSSDEPAAETVEDVESVETVETVDVSQPTEEILDEAIEDAALVEQVAPLEDNETDEETDAAASTDSDVRGEVDTVDAVATEDEEPPTPDLESVDSERVVAVPATLPLTDEAAPNAFHEGIRSTIERTDDPPLTFTPAVRTTNRQFNEYILDRLDTAPAEATPPPPNADDAVDTQHEGRSFRRMRRLFAKD